mmetsp:Transcript_28768/g.70161  ORF Transcript_28768/g.70161 Transcript_28768/m.70161 type:complete len:224 (+) Transcript_28768:999-1670(+)
MALGDYNVPPFPSFVFPMYLAVDSKRRDVYVSDRKGHRIHSIDLDTKTVSVCAGSVIGREDGHGTRAKFECPGGVAVSHDAHVYVADMACFMHRRIDPWGTVSTLGSLGRLVNRDEYFESTSMRQFWIPCAITLSKCERKLCIADPYNNQIRMAPIPRLKNVTRNSRVKSFDVPIELDPGDTMPISSIRDRRYKEDLKEDNSNELSEMDDAEVRRWLAPAEWG